MKNIKKFVKPKKVSVEPAASDKKYASGLMGPSNRGMEIYGVTGINRIIEVGSNYGVTGAAWPSEVKIDPFDNTLLGKGAPNFVLDPKSVSESSLKPLTTPEEDRLLKDLFVATEDKKEEKRGSRFITGQGIHNGYLPGEVWIQTHSGRRFNPINPNPESIVIQDIAHALSMQCRFSGHTHSFYSVAQHSILVSYVCDKNDALWALLHDATEAYLVDIPTPLKRSGQLEGYIEIEKKMQEAICQRFNLPMQEPWSVKQADKRLLATEARDLMSPLHPDWKTDMEPLPFKIEAWDPSKAKDMFMKRFFELTCQNYQKDYQYYLDNKKYL